jgi:hypothetical protein
LRINLYKVKAGEVVVVKKTAFEFRLCQKSINRPTLVKAGNAGKRIVRSTCCGFDQRPVSYIATGHPWRIRKQERFRRRGAW